MTVASKLVSLVILCWVSVSCAQETNFAIDKVSIDSIGCQNVAASQLQFACHRLGRGQGFAIAERRYWPQRTTDDDSFEKLTVYFSSKPNRGHVLEIPNDGMSVFFSSGPSSFPGKHGCYGVAKAGKVEVTDISEAGLTIKLDASIDLKSPLGWKGECKQIHFHKVVAAQMISFDELNTWYGRVAPGYDLWNESRP